MFQITLAGIGIEIDNRYGYVEEQCIGYRDGGEKPAFRVRVSSDELNTYLSACGRPMTPGEAESLLLYRRICEKLPAYDAFMLHAAVVRIGGRAYAFSARRGVGKTTHARLWQRVFPGEAEILNGDKPILRIQGGRFWAFGTPWGGKEGTQMNVGCPLSAVCFLEQAAQNRIEICPVADTVARMLDATVYSEDAMLRDQLAALIGQAVRVTPAYRLYCRPDEEAVRLAFHALSQAQNRLI